MSPTPHLQEPRADSNEDEVRTPTWLTATGVGLFMLACVGWLMTRPPQPTIDQMRQVAAQPQGSVESAAAAPAPSASAAARPRSSAADLPRPIFKLPSKPAPH